MLLVGCGGDDHSARTFDPAKIVLPTHKYEVLHSIGEPDGIALAIDTPFTIWRYTLDDPKVVGRMIHNWYFLIRGDTVVLLRQEQRP